MDVGPLSGSGERGGRGDRHAAGLGPRRRDDRARRPRRRGRPPHRPRSAAPSERCDSPGAGAGRSVPLSALRAHTPSPPAPAAGAPAVAATVAYVHPLLGPALIPLAGWVAASRVTLRVHHASDAIAGAGLGAAAAVLAHS